MKHVEHIIDLLVIGAIFALCAQLVIIAIEECTEAIEKDRPKVQHNGDIIYKGHDYVHSFMCPCGEVE